MKTNETAITIGANTVFLVCALLGGWYGSSFFGNIFTALTLISVLLVLAITITVDSKEFAKERRETYWNYSPLILAFISAGFGWWVCFAMWLILFVCLIMKTITGKEALKLEDAQRAERAKVTVEYPLNDSSQRE